MSQERAKPFVATPGDDARFMSFVRKEPNGCWIWTGSTAQRGYGQFSFAKGNWRAHRWSYRRFRGEIAGFVCHTCDTPACVNPAHLFLGNQFVNMGDAAVKGRVARGSQHWHATVTPSVVREIVASAEPYPVLGRRHGIHPTTVGKIKRRERWAHVEVA